MPKPTVEIPEKVANPLLAVPRIAPYVRVKFDSQGYAQIKRQPPPGRGVGGWLARHFAMHKSVRVNLDQRGTFFWEQVDGTRNLQMIARLLKNRFGVNEKEASDAVVLFTKSLMRRGLIQLDLSYRKEFEA